MSSKFRMRFRRQFQEKFSKFLEKLEEETRKDVQDVAKSVDEYAEVDHRTETGINAEAVRSYEYNRELELAPVAALDTSE